MLTRVLEEAIMTLQQDNWKKVNKKEDRKKLERERDIQTHVTASTAAAETTTATTQSAVQAEKILTSVYFIHNVWGNENFLIAEKERKTFTSNKKSANLF